MLAEHPHSFIWVSYNGINQSVGDWLSGNNWNTLRPCELRIQKVNTGGHYGISSLFMIKEILVNVNIEL